MLELDQSLSVLLRYLCRIVVDMDAIAALIDILANKSERIRVLFSELSNGRLLEMLRRPGHRYRVSIVCLLLLVLCQIAEHYLGCRGAGIDYSDWSRLLT